MRILIYISSKVLSNYKIGILLNKKKLELTALRLFVIVATNVEHEESLETNIYLNHLKGLPPKTITKGKHGNEADAHKIIGERENRV